MGGFFMARRELRRSADEILARAEQSFAQQGFAAGRRVATEFADILVFPKLAVGAGVAMHEDAGKVLISTGTLIYREAVGSVACRVLAHDLAAMRSIGARCSAITASSLRIQRASDYLPIRSAPITYSMTIRQTFVSSSFLAVLDVVPRATLARQSVYEYVFQRATYGGATLVDEISLFDCRTEFVIGREVTRRPVPSRPPMAPCPQRHDAELLTRNLGNLRRSLAAITRSFGDHIDTALSGGYDSRLLLALLLEQGARPNVHVYGSPGDPDVAVAKTIAAGERFELTHSDKAGAPEMSRDAFAAHVRRNLLAFDGTPGDGVFDNGTDLATRRERCAHGELMLNGGGGEVFRNFFYLPERDYSVREFVWAFYSQFDPAAMHPPYTAAAFTAALADKVMAYAGPCRRGRFTRRSRVPVSGVSLPLLDGPQQFEQQPAGLRDYAFHRSQHRAGCARRSAQAKNGWPVRGGNDPHDQPAAGCISLRLWPRFRAPSAIRTHRERAAHHASSAVASKTHLPCQASQAPKAAVFPYRGLFARGHRFGVFVHGPALQYSAYSRQRAIQPAVHSGTAVPDLFD